MNVRQVLQLFDLRETEIDLYHVVLASGLASATELARLAGVSRTSVYDVLERLIASGLVSETVQDGVKKFFVLPPEKIELLLAEKETQVAHARQALQELKSLYAGKRVSQKPRLQLFEGKAELQQMMKDLLLYRDITVQAYWPVKKMLELLTPAFMDTFHKERLARNIALQVIWPVGQAPSALAHRFLGADRELKREARVAPLDTEFALGYSVYGRTVRFISSSRENFGFLVESAELADMMRSQFKILWKISRAVKR